MAAATTMNRILHKATLQALYLHCILLVRLLLEPSIQGMKEPNLAHVQRLRGAATHRRSG